MLWIKVFHIFFVVSWFAAVFYLPRIYVNLSMVPADSHAERERLLLMGRKLYRFGHALMGLGILLGVWLWLGYGISGGWLHAKMVIVAALIAYYIYCGRLLKRFQAGANTRKHTWYRVFNEVPVLGLLAILILVVVKPF